MDINGDLIRRVWEKAHPIPGQDSDTFRTDVSGKWIRLKEFNNEDSIYGWTIYALDGEEHKLLNIAKLIPVHTFNNSNVSDALAGGNATFLSEPIL